MSLLPWLLDWPPSRGSIAVFLVVTAFSVGTIVVLGGGLVQPDDGPVTVEDVDVSVTLNDEIEYPPGANGTVQKCVASGPPGDSVLVRGAVVVDVPVEDRWAASGDRQVAVTVSLAHTDETTTETVTGPGRITRDVFWLLEDDETLSVNGTATVQVRVKESGSTVANATETVPVREGTRHYEC